MGVKCSLCFVKVSAVQQKYFCMTQIIIVTIREYEVDYNTEFL